MSTGFLLAALLVVLFLGWVVARVRQHARRSREQWEAVDKSRLREWDDEDDW